MSCSSAAVNSCWKCSLHPVTSNDIFVFKGVPQWIEFSFAMVKTIQQLQITFQGGFAPKSCVLEGVPENDCDTDSIDTPKFEFYPKDSNETQTFELENLLSSKKFKLTFLSSYDFYGRIIIYDLNMLGN